MYLTCICAIVYIAQMIELIFLEGNIGVLEKPQVCVTSNKFGAG